MRPPWRVARPDWREAHWALLSGLAIYGAAWAVGYLCSLIAGAGFLSEETNALDALPFFVMFLLMLRAAERSGPDTMRTKLSLHPLRFDRTTASFSIGILVLFYLVNFLLVLGLPSEGETSQSRLIPLLIPFIVGIVITELLFRGYLFTRMALSAGSLYASAVCSLLGGVLYYESGIAVVVLATVLNLILCWARVKSGTVMLPIFLLLLMAVQPVLVSILAVLISWPSLYP